MKKLVSTLIALTLIVMFTACNSAEVKEGQIAGKAYLEAFNAANGDISALNAAYVAAATSFAKTAVASDQANLDWQNGFIDACSNNMNALGTYYAISSVIATAQGQDMSAAIETITTNLKEKGTEFQTAYINSLKMLTNSQQAENPTDPAVEESTAVVENTTVTEEPISTEDTTVTEENVAKDTIITDNSTVEDTTVTKE